MPRWKWRASALHLYAGLPASFVVVVLGVTGALLAFEDEIDRALNPRLSYITPGPTRLAWQDVATSAAKHYPGYTPTGIALPASEDFSATVQIVNFDTRHRIAVAVNQYTGEILGDSDHSNNFMQYVRRMHTGLMLGGPGEALVVFFGFLLVVLAVSGIRLWLRRRNHPAPDSALHTWIGGYAALFVLLFGVTALRPVPLGLIWTPPWREASFTIKPPESGQRLSADQLIAKAQFVLPGAKVVAVGLRGPGNEFPLSVAMRFPEDHTSNGKSAVFLNPYTGDVTGLINTRELPPLVKYGFLWNWEIHMGQIFGLPTRILASLISAGMPVLAITGFLVWWRRRARRLAAQQNAGSRRLQTA